MLIAERAGHPAQYYELRTRELRSLHHRCKPRLSLLGMIPIGAVPAGVWLLKKLIAGHVVRTEVANNVMRVGVLVGMAVSLSAATLYLGFAWLSRRSWLRLPPLAPPCTEPPWAWLVASSRAYREMQRAAIEAKSRFWRRSYLRGSQGVLPALRRLALAMGGRLISPDRASLALLDWLDAHGWGPVPMVLQGSRAVVAGQIGAVDVLVCVGARIAWEVGETRAAFKTPFGPYFLPGSDAQRYAIAWREAISSTPYRLTNVLLALPASYDRFLLPDVGARVRAAGFTPHVGRDGVRLSRIIGQPALLPSPQAMASASVAAAKSQPAKVPFGRMQASTGRHIPVLPAIQRDYLRTIQRYYFEKRPDGRPLGSNDPALVSPETLIPLVSLVARSLRARACAL